MHEAAVLQAIPCRPLVQPGSKVLSTVFPEAGEVSDVDTAPEMFRSDRRVSPNSQRLKECQEGTHLGIHLLCPSDAVIRDDEEVPLPDWLPCCSACSTSLAYQTSSAVTLHDEGNVSPSESFTFCSCPLNTSDDSEAPPSTGPEGSSSNRARTRGSHSRHPSGT